MPELYIDWLAPGLLTQVVVTFLITAYLVSLKQKTSATRWVTGFFFSMTAFAVVVFVKGATVHLSPMLLEALEVLTMFVGLVMLVQFAYTFHPNEHSSPNYSQESERIFHISLFASILVVGYVAQVFAISMVRAQTIHTWYRLVRIVNALHFVWAFLVFLRCNLNFSKQESQANTTWFQCLVYPRDKTARAPRNFALVMLLPLLISGTFVLQDMGGLSLYIAKAVRSTGLLLFFFAFVVVYLNVAAEFASLRVKLIGISLVTLLAILGIIGVQVGISYANVYQPKSFVPEHQTFQFRPNERNGYDILSIPVQFDTDFGQRLDFSAVDSDDVPLLLPFPFVFYDHIWQRIVVSQNGLIAFGHGFPSWQVFYDFHPGISLFSIGRVSNIALPQGQVFVKSTSQDCTITWYQMNMERNAYTNTMQLVLFSDGTFTMTFLEMAPAEAYNYRDTSTAPMMTGIFPGNKSERSIDLRFTEDIPYVGVGTNRMVENYYLEYRRAMHKQMLPLVIIVLVSTLFIVTTFPLFFQVTIIGPLTRLLDGVKQADQGDLVVEVPVVYQDEIGALTHFFNKMIGTVRQTNENLEMYVSHRTEELSQAIDALIKEITERRRVEGELQQSRKLLQDFMDNSPSFMSLQDLEGRFLVVNRSIAALFHSIPDNLIGCFSHDFLDDEMSHLSQDADHRVIVSGAPVEVEIFIEHDGQLHTYLKTKFPLYDEQGTIDAIGCVGIDISERKVTEKALRQSEERLRRILSSSPDGVLVLDIEGVIQYANPSSHLLLNQTSLEGMFFGYPLTSHEGTELEVIHYNQEYSVVAMRVLEIDWEGDRAFVVSLRDITMRKKAENALHQRNRELMLLNRTSQAFRSTLNLDEVLVTVLRETRQLLDIRVSAFWLLHPDSGDLVCQHAEGPGSESLIQSYIKVGLSITGCAVQTGEPLIVSDVSENSLDYSFADQYIELGLRSILSIPLYTSQGVIGVLDLADSRLARFSDDDLSLMEPIAIEAADAIEKANLYESERKRVQQLDALRMTMTEISAELQLDRLLTSLVERAVALLGGTDAELCLYDEERKDLQVVVCLNMIRNFTGHRLPLGVGAAGYVAQTRQPLIIENYLEWHLRLPQYEICGARSVLLVPLLGGENLVGVLAVGSASMNRIFTLKDVQLLELFAHQATIGIQNAHLFAETQKLAITDSLLEIYNRRHFFNLAQSAFDKAQNYLHNFSVVMMDADNFKLVNDTYGHVMGDYALRMVAQQCRDVIRSQDIVGRYGGEEIVMVLPETEGVDAVKIAERLRVNIAHTSIELDNVSIHITISLGVASLQDDEDVTLEELINRADQALYVAKRSGKNCVVAWDAEI